jgi:hypothetical protein
MLPSREGRDSRSSRAKQRRHFQRAATRSVTKDPSLSGGASYPTKTARGRPLGTLYEGCLPMLSGRGDGGMGDGGWGG